MYRCDLWVFIRMNAFLVSGNDPTNVHMCEHCTILESTQNIMGCPTASEIRYSIYNKRFMCVYALSEY